MFSIFAEYLITPIWINTAVHENIWTVSVENFYIHVLYKIVWNFISIVIKQICPDYIGKIWKQCIQMKIYEKATKYLLQFIYYI